MTTLIDHIEVRWRPSGSQGVFQTQIIKPSQGTVTIPGVERGVSYDVEARSVSARGTASDWVPVTHTVALAALPLNAPTGLTSISLADGVHVAWTPGDVQLRADVQFEVWRAPDNSGSPGAYALLTTVLATAYTDGVTDGVVRWYQVRSKDMQGNFSAFSPAISSAGKTVANGATAGATIGPGGNVGGAVDANGRALVDLSQGGHLNKTIDNIGDGSVFLRGMQGTFTEQVDNSDFEASGAAGAVPGWEAPYATLGYDTTTPYSGTRSLIVTTTSQYGAAVTLRRYPCTPGQKFLISGVVKNTTNTGPAYVQIVFLNASAGLAGNFGGSTSATAWTAVSAQGVAPAGAVSFYIGLQNNGVAGSVAEFDQIRLSRVRSLDSEVQDGSNYLRSASRIDSAGSLPIANADCALPANADGSLPGWDASTLTAGALWYIDTGSPDAGYTQDYVLRTPNAAVGSILGSHKFACRPGDVVSIKARVKSISGTYSGVLASFFNNSDSYISSANAATTSAAWTTASMSTVAPANAAYCRLEAYGSAPSSGTASVALQWVRASINDVRVAGSGAQVGDQRNLLPILSAGAQAVWQSLSISYTTTAGSTATATISVSAAQILGLIAAGGLVSYNASSASVTGTGGTAITYYLYYLDATYAGGTQTLYATTSPNTLRSQLGIVYIGSVTVTFPTSGTGGGSGGGGLCVADDMFVADGRPAGGAALGDLFDCIDLPSGQHRHQRTLLGVTRGTEDCVRIVTDRGAALVCSISTPFDVPDGRIVLAPDMRGEDVLTDLGIERVSSVTPVGPRPVSRIHLGGVSYAAGENALHRIYSHNGTLKP